MNKIRLNRDLRIKEDKEMKHIKINDVFTLEQLVEMDFRELKGTTFAGYLIFYRGDYHINRERYLFHKIKSDNGGQSQYKLSCEYKV